MIYSLLLALNWENITNIVRKLTGEKTDEVTLKLFFVHQHSHCVDCGIETVQTSRLSKAETSLKLQENKTRLKINKSRMFDYKDPGDRQGPRPEHLHISSAGPDDQQQHQVQR